MKPFSKKADSLGDPVTPIQPAIDRGQREVSKYDPEYEFLVKLVRLISTTTPEAMPEIKALSQAFPFHTIDDVGDLTAKIWTLATTKYNIPRNWLINNLPEKSASLKKADLWPSQEQAGDMLSHEHNSLSYNNEQEADTSVCGPRPDEVKVAKPVKLNINKVIKILEAKEPRVSHVDFTNNTIELDDGTVLTFDEATKRVLEMDKTADVSCCPKCRSKNIGVFNG